MSARHDEGLDDEWGPTAKSDAELFLAALDREALEFTFQTFDDNKERAAAYKKANKRADPSRARIFNGSFTQHRATLRALNDYGNGVFITVNETDLHGRAAENVTRVRYLFLDLDGSPLAPVLAAMPTPHIVVESSPGRWHVYWRVEEDGLNAATREAAAKRFYAAQVALAKRFKGDLGINDLPRVMRLPGFTHRKGEPFGTRLDRVNDIPPYRMDELVPPQAEDPKSGGAGQQEQPRQPEGEKTELRLLNEAALANLGAWVPKLFPGATPYKGGPGYRISPEMTGRPDKEEDLLISPQGIKDCADHDNPDETRDGKRTPIDIVMRWGKRPLGFALTVGQAADWLRKQLGTPDPIMRLNQNHAVVLLGGQVLIVREQHDGPTFMSPESLHLWHAAERVEFEGNKIAVSRAWIKHPGRRQYSNVVFDPRGTNPEHYNLWRGFAVQPDPSKSCKKFLAHIRDNICSGNSGHFLWVMGFLAHMVQHPEEKPGVSLVLRGQEGTGKGFFANVIGQLCVQHYVVVAQSSQLTGRFNAHFQRALLIFVDEGFWAGDKAGEGALKHLVTDKELLIEGKHKDAFMVRNLSRLIIASNEKWVVPAGIQARRWCVLDVAGTRANDRAYFGAIDAELSNGGLAALMHYLTTFDLKSVNIHTPPKTAALLEQKEESFAPHVQWWDETLQRGSFRYESEPAPALDFSKRDKITETNGWPTSMPKDRLWESYKLWMRDHNVRSRVAAASVLHRWLKDAKLLPGASESRPRDDSVRTRLIHLPALEACRAAFDAHLGQPRTWAEGDYARAG